MKPTNIYSLMAKRTSHHPLISYQTGRLPAVGFNLLLEVSEGEMIICCLSAPSWSGASPIYRQPVHHASLMNKERGLIEHQQAAEWGKFYLTSFWGS
jgi:hypothetical protein